MPWMKLTVPIEDSAPTYNSISRILSPLYWQGESETQGSAVALYRVEEPIYATFYLSPAAAVLMAGKTEFDFAICSRPTLTAHDRKIGDTASADTSWVELPDEQRQPEPFDQGLADAQDAEWRMMHGDDAEEDPS